MSPTTSSTIQTTLTSSNRAAQLLVQLSPITLRFSSVNKLYRSCGRCTQIYDPHGLTSPRTKAPANVYFKQ
ncbi:Uncharacterised protein [Mycobacteroides abscessus subsp. abscessus]|nr:Uncharacterised protein [Mycobacteroides abscessus subsp. abscessus]